MPDYALYLVHTVSDLLDGMTPEETSTYIVIALFVWAVMLYCFLSQLFENMDGDQ